MYVDARRVTERELAADVIEYMLRCLRYAAMPVAYATTSLTLKI